MLTLYIYTGWDKKNPQPFVWLPVHLTYMLIQKSVYCHPTFTVKLIQSKQLVLRPYYEELTSLGLPMVQV